MAIWLVLAGMVVAVAAALGMPWWRRGRAGASQGADEAVYRDQLAEIERDAARGLIGGPEAEAARNEISRRLLAAAARKGGAPRQAGRGAFVTTALAVPAVALPLYLVYGSAHLPDLPLEQRLETAAERGDVEAMIARIERNVEEHPGDTRSWEILARIYEKLQRFGDAASAYAKLIELLGPKPELLTSFGEMDTFANGGVVTDIAARAFADALKSLPKDPKARFFTALRLKQTGQKAEALAAFEALKAESPADAIWHRVLDGQIAELRGPTPEDVAAAEDLSEDQRKEMIRGMVDGLDERLKSEGGSLEDWKKLIRSRMVLGEADKARAALADATARFKDKPDDLAALETFAKELGLP